MPVLTEEQIKEIAEQLDCGLCCYWHKHTGDLLFVPDPMGFPNVEPEFFEEDTEKLENNFEDYFGIEPLQSGDSFKIMGNFTNQLEGNNKLKEQLIEALNGKKPFANFKWVIDNSGPYRQEWFDFKDAWLREWVRKRFSSYLDSAV